MLVAPEDSVSNAKHDGSMRDNEVDTTVKEHRDPELTQTIALNGNQVEDNNEPDPEVSILGHERKMMKEADLGVGDSAQNLNTDDVAEEKKISKTGAVIINSQTDDESLHQEAAKRVTEMSEEEKVVMNDYPAIETESKFLNDVPEIDTELKQEGKNREPGSDQMLIESSELQQVENDDECSTNKETLEEKKRNPVKEKEGNLQNNKDSDIIEKKISECNIGKNEQESSTEETELENEQASLYTSAEQYVETKKEETFLSQQKLCTEKEDISLKLINYPVDHNEDSKKQLDDVDYKHDAEEPHRSQVTTANNGLSFAQAFSSDCISPKSNNSPIVTPTLRKAPIVSLQGETFPPDPQLTPNNSTSSHSALSAARNKKASSLISTYEDNVAHSSLPGDSILIKKVKGPEFSSTVSPGSERIIKKKTEATTVELAQLPDMNSIRQKFEESAGKSSGSFEFGESFRQKKRHEQLSEKESKEEAKVSIQGFNEKEINQGRTASGEIDTSSLPKSFTFELSHGSSITPNDGVCRVDYSTTDFRALVFVVHRTRGMLLLREKSPKSNSVPGGSILENEFLDAAQQSGSPQVQLQIAAREAAARQLYESTGLDIRQQANRFKPAVLNVNPNTDAARDFQCLRNEHENNLYYFLQVDEDDFSRLKDVQGQNLNSKAGKPSSDPGDEEPVALQLSKKYTSFKFVHDPVDAHDVLKKDGNDAASALNLIMNAASTEIRENTQTLNSSTKNGPDAKAKVHSSSGISLENHRVRTVGDGQMEENQLQQAQIQQKHIIEEKHAGIRFGQTTKNENTFQHDEAKLSYKTPSTDPSLDGIAATCCCSFW